MTTPRRRIIRPDPPTATIAVKVQRLRSKLDKERQGLGRWMSRLKRSFNAVQKKQQTIARLERQITKLEGE